MSAAHAEAGGPHKSRLGPGLLLLLALPRLLRMGFPELWVEDDFYPASAFLVSRGEQPYRDFVHPHLPLLEFLVAAWIRLTGPGHRSLELLTAAAVFATSVLVLRLSERSFGRRAAVWGACVFAWSSLSFRYHVFERECFEALGLCAALWIAFRRERQTPASGVAAGACLALAAAVKLTALVPGVAVPAFLALGRRDRRVALWTAGTAAAGLAIAAAVCSAVYGRDFWLQVGLFHLAKGRHAAVPAPLSPARVLDLAAPLFALGALRVARRRRAPEPLALLGWALLGYAFYGFASPTVWAHNWLELLPAVAAVAGFGAEGVWQELRRLRAPQAHRPVRWLRAAAAPAAIALCLAGPTPLRNENWERSSVYGFGYLPRAEVELLARALREASGEDEPVVAPSFLCFEAGRKPLIRFPETWGVYRDAVERAEREGWLRVWRETAGQDFFERIGTTSRRWQQPLFAALRSGEVRVLVPDSEALLQALVGPPPARLIQLGLRPVLRTEHFTLWRRADEPAAPAGQDP